MRAVEVLPTLESGQKLWAGVGVHPGPERLKWDVHQAFEILVVLHGCQERHYESFDTKLEAGQVALAAAWEPHGHRTLSAGTVVFVLFFRPEFLGDELLDGASWLDLFVAAPRDRPWVTAEAVRRRVLGIAGEMSAEAEALGRGWVTALRLGILQLLFTIGREWDPPDSSTRQPGARPSDLARIAPALSLVQTRLGLPVTLRDAARACSLSASWFSAVFRHTMGLSFGEFALRHRVAQAARLLLESEMPLGAIADQVGFVDASHLHRAFAKRYGSTPARYRESARGHHG